MPEFPNMDMAVHSAMNEQLEAIVLSLTDYRENDAVIHVLTADKGRMALIGTGVRKVSSKNGRNIQPCTHCSILYDHKENRSMQRIRTVSSLHLFRHMKEDLKASIAGSLLCEAVQSLLEEGEPCQEIYDSLLKAFLYLDEGKHVDTTVCAFLSQMLNDLGFGLQVDGCAICNDTKVTSFSIGDGGFLCQHHMLAHRTSIWDPLDLKRFRLINKAGMKHFDILSESTQATSRDVMELVGVVRMHTGAPLRSYDLYKKI